MNTINHYAHVVHNTINSSLGETIAFIVIAIAAIYIFANLILWISSTIRTKLIERRERIECTNGAEIERKHEENPVYEMLNRKYEEAERMTKKSSFCDDMKYVTGELKNKTVKLFFQALNFAVIMIASTILLFSGIYLSCKVLQ